MARKLSRRSLAHYVAENIVDAKKRPVAVQQLAAHLVYTRRTKELGLIIRDVEAVLLERGVVMGTIISATELSAEVCKTVERFVAAQTGAKTIALDARIDPTVLGGIKLTLPGRELDRTVQHQLTTLKTRFKKV